MGSEMPGGYSGKVLRVNLSTGVLSVETQDDLVRRKYLGGAGFVTYYLWKELAAGTEPLGPGNKLVFAPGPFTGIPLPGTDRFCAGAKSPLTGGIAKSESGGYWGSELKRAAFDAIIVEGKADKPAYLWVHDGEAIIRDATHLWGHNTKETQEAIRADLNDDRIRLALIGPAGEKQVRFACVMSGLFDAFGRGGLGAVMGAKNLKAIAVRGHQMTANLEKIKELRKWLLANTQLPKHLMEYGTGTFMQPHEATGNLPVRNFRDGLFPGVKKIDAQTMKATIGIGMDGCYACPVRCKKVVESKEPYQIDRAYGGPEYETLAALGCNCGIDDLKAIAKGGELCNAYSLDTISTGGVIAFAMECFENGIIGVEETGGIELRFGNSEAMLKTVELVARREGIGCLLGEGVSRAAKMLGPKAEGLAVHVKGLEAGYHDPRSKPGLGLGYMVNPHGADHCCNMHDNSYVSQSQLKNLRSFGFHEPLPNDELGPRKVALFKVVQARHIVTDCMGICMYLPYTFEQIYRMATDIIGWDTGIVELEKAAERVLTTARLFNIREGFTTDDDRLPPRFLQPKTDGPLSQKTFDASHFEDAKRYYYRLMGWDERTGVPLLKKVVELGIV